MSLDGQTTIHPEDEKKAAEDMSPIFENALLDTVGFGRKKARLAPNSMAKLKRFLSQFIAGLQFATVIAPQAPTRSNVPAIQFARALDQFGKDAGPISPPTEDGAAPIDFENSDKAQPTPGSQLGAIETSTSNGQVEPRAITPGSGGKKRTTINNSTTPEESGNTISNEDGKRTNRQTPGNDENKKGQALSIPSSDEGVPRTEKEKPAETSPQEQATKDKRQDGTLPGVPGAPDDDRQPKPGMGAPLFAEPGDAKPTQTADNENGGDGVAVSKEDEDEEEETPERSSFTQNVNSLRYRQELKSIDRKLKQLAKQEKAFAKQYKKLNKEIDKLRDPIKYKELTLRTLQKTSRICVYAMIICSITALVTAPLLLTAALAFIPSALWSGVILAWNIKNWTDNKIKSLEAELEPQLKQIRAKEAERDVLKKQSEALRNQQRMIINRRLFLSRPENNEA